MNTHAELKPCPQPLGCDDLVMRLMYELHAHVPEEQRPVSMSDLSGEQAARARRAVHAVLAEWESAKSALEATRPPASAAPVDELVEQMAKAIYANNAYMPERHAKQAAEAAYAIVSDQLTVYARRVAELEGALKLFADVATAYEENGYDDSKKLYFTMKELKDARAALTGENG